MSVLRAAEAQHACDNPAAMAAQTITIPISEPTPESGDRPSSSAVYRNAISKNGFPVFDQKTMWEMHAFATETFANENAIGWRPIENGKAGPFTWMTYSKFAGVSKLPTASPLTPNAARRLQDDNVFASVEDCTCMILKTMLQKGSLQYLLPSWNALARKGESSRFYSHIPGSRKLVKKPLHVLT